MHYPDVVDYPAASPAAVLSSAPTVAKRPLLPALTGLRFVAALAVVLHHYRAFVELPPIVQPLLEHARSAVGLFFVLSGFVLVYNYGDWFRVDLSALPAFARARFARIVPSHLLALLLMTPVTLFIAQPQAPLSWLTGSWLANLFLVHAYWPLGRFHIWITPSWSVSAEVSFYLLFPFFVRYVLGRLRGTRSLLGLAGLLYAVEVLTFVGMLVVFANRPAPDFYYLDRVMWSPFLRVWEFLLGGVLGALFLQAQQQRTGWLAVLQQSRRVRDWAALATLASLPLTSLLVDAARQAAQVTSAWTPYVAYTLQFCALIAVLASGPTFLSSLLEHPVALLLGEASYSLYLLHWIPFFVLNKQHEAGQSVPPLLWLAALVGTLVVSIVVYLTVEVPARRLLRGRPARAGQRVA